MFQYPFYLHIVKYYIKIPEINLSLLPWYFPRVWQYIEQIISANAKISVKATTSQLIPDVYYQWGPANTLNCRPISRFSGFDSGFTSIKFTLSPSIHGHKH